MIVFLVIFGLILYLAERYSMAHVLDEVEIETSLDKVLVEPGEEFIWTMTIQNKKRLMVPYLKLKEQVPERLFYAENGEPVETKEKMGLQSVLYLAGRQKAELQRRVRFEKRGRYFFRGASVEAGDFMGIQVVLESYPELKEMVVKPKPCSHEKLPVLLGGYLGEFSVRKSLFEDPILTASFREYTGREPFRAISWTQSARLGRLLVKEQECTMDLSCSVLLNTECSGQEGSGELLERCFSLVRSICEELENRKIPYDFRTNGVIAGAMGNWSQVDEGLGAGHLETMLEGLGRMTHDHKESAGTFFKRVLRGVPAGKSLMVVTPEMGEELRRLVSALEERSGRKVLVISPMDLMPDPGEYEDERGDECAAENETGHMTERAAENEPGCVTERVAENEFGRVFEHETDLASLKGEKEVEE